MVVMAVGVFYLESVICARRRACGVAVALAASTKAKLMALSSIPVCVQGAQKGPRRAPFSQAQPPQISFENHKFSTCHLGIFVDMGRVVASSSGNPVSLSPLSMNSGVSFCLPLPTSPILMTPCLVPGVGFGSHEMLRSRITFYPQAQTLCSASG